MTRKSLQQLAAEANDDGGGIVCPSCGCRDFLVDKTEQGSSSTFRWKHCRNCGHRVVTRTESSERIIRDVKQRRTDDEGDLVLRLA